jgi:L-iditol 2-dehydrogenase
MTSGGPVRAVVLEAPGQVVLRETRVDDRPGEVLVAPEVVGICGTDLGVIAGEVAVSMPRVLGHEVVGRIVGGDLAGSWPMGTRVLVDPSQSCGRCPVCRRGSGHLCPAGGLMGRDVDGVMADLVSVPADRLHQVPESLDDDTAALLQVLGTCVHAQRTAFVSPGRMTAVVGLGVAGLLQVQLLEARGAGLVLAVGRSALKRDLAAGFGALPVVPEEAEAVMQEASSGRGAHVVIECAGSSEALDLAVRLASPGGVIVRFGSGGDGQPAPLAELYRRELTMTNPRAATPEDYEDAVALAVQGKVSAKGLVSHRLDPEQVAEALAAGGLRADPMRLKAVVRWHGGER